MGTLEVQHLVKYPPFDAHRLVASELPISRNNEIILDNVDKQEAFQIVAKSIICWCFKKTYFFGWRSLWV